MCATIFKVLQTFSELVTATTRSQNGWVESENQISSICKWISETSFGNRANWFTEKTWPTRIMPSCIGITSYKCGTKLEQLSILSEIYHLVLTHSYYMVIENMCNQAHKYFHFNRWELFHHLETWLLQFSIIFLILKEVAKIYIFFNSHFAFHRSKLYGFGEEILTKFSLLREPSL